MAALVAAAFSSCTFFRIDTRALTAHLEEEGIDMTVESKPSRKVISGNGVEARQFRGDLEPFTSIQSSIPADIEYSEGEQSVEIIAPSNILPYIGTSVREGVLGLHFKGVRVRNVKDMTVIIRTPELESVTIDGAGDLDMNGLVRTGDFRIEISGAGDVKIDRIEADSFTLRISGAGDFDADDMKCISFDANVIGSGDIDVERIEAETVKVNISGAGDCTLAGRAKKGDFSVSGAGSVDIRALQLEDVQSSMNGMAKIFR